MANSRMFLFQLGLLVTALGKMVMKIMLYITMTIKMTTAAVINKGHLLSTQIDCVEYVQFAQF